MDCVLCNAISASSQLIHKNEYVAVIVNIEPVKYGHVMVLPVRHAEQLSDLDAQESEAFLKMIDRCMLAVTSMSTEPPMCLVNGWKHRTQPHLHAHVLPSKKNLRGLFIAAEGTEERKRADNETIKKMIEELRQRLTP